MRYGFLGKRTMRGKNVAPRTTNHAVPSPREIPMLNDTVRMPWDAHDSVVPPALAILYRLAVGPAADYYVPRFMRFDRGGFALYETHTIRAQLAETLAAVKLLQREIEESWQRSNAVPRTLDHAVTFVRIGGDLIDSVNFNPFSGRLRVALGSAIAKLSGKNI